MNNRVVYICIEGFVWNIGLVYEERKKLFRLNFILYNK